METLKARLTGLVPLILHNARLADPLDPISKAMKTVSSKRKKTDADFEELARLEFEGGLYMVDDEPVIPARLIYGLLAGKGGAARKQKSGPEAKAGIVVSGNFPLKYDGPRDVAGLWRDARFRSRVNAKIGQATVMRTRPIFEEWAVTIAVQYNPELVNRAQLIEWLELGGDQVGLGDWRPQYGRFSVEIL